MCSERTSSSCSTSYKPGDKYKWGKAREVRTTSGTYPWSFVTQMHVFRNGLHRVTRMSNDKIVPHTYDKMVGPSVDDMQYYNYEIWSIKYDIDTGLKYIFIISSVKVH
jgi:hypothetical protein